MTLIKTYVSCLLILIPLQLIHKNVEVVEKRLCPGLSHITLKCKNFEVICIEFKSSEECSNVASSIENLSNVGEWVFVRENRLLITKILQKVRNSCIRFFTVLTLTLKKMDGRLLQ